MSYSGQCYLSQYIGGRSANRGECAQPCRKKYSVKTSDGKVIAENIHALCLKDFNASNHISEMIDAGVFSFKIEGRLKEIEYVKNVTAYYRQELDKYSEKISSGKSIYSFEPCLEKSFNRGFTDYFLEERTNCFNFVSPKSRGEYLGEVIAVSKDFFVINTNKTIHPQDGLMYESDGFLVNKVVGNKIYPNKKFEIKKGTKIFRNTDVEFQKKLILPVKRQIGVNLFVGKSEIVAVDEDNISYSLFINATDAPQNLERMIESYKKQLSKTGDSDFYIKNIEISSDVPFMLIGEINSLRRNLFDGLMKKRLEEYMRESQKEIKLLPYYKTEVDYRANVHNASAKAFYNDCNCNVLEPSLETSFPKHQVELMRTKHCIKFALGICKSEEDLVLIDECGKSYPLKFDCKNCEMVVLSSQKK